MTKRRRGFAVMDPERQRAIASKGGKAAHEKGTAHRWSEQEAKEAGRKGGAASHRNGHRTATRLQVTGPDTVSTEQGEPNLSDQNLSEQNVNEHADQNATDPANRIVSDEFANERIAPDATADDSEPDHSRS